MDLLLIGQYLQNETVAKEFAVYYDLYNKYRSDYQIEDILCGCASETIVQRAKDAAFDERLSLLGLLLDTMNGEMRNVVETEGAILECLRILKQVKQELAEPNSNYVTSLHQHMEEEKQTLTAGTRASAIDYETRYALQYTIQFLDYQIADLGRSGSLTNSEAFQRIKVKYDAGVANHKAEISKIKERLKYLFAFADEVFGDGQEMLILVTELTVRYYCGKFITKFGCDEYFKHNQNLMFYERKKELLSEIASLTEL